MIAERENEVLVGKLPRRRHYFDALQSLMYEEGFTPWEVVFTGHVEHDDLLAAYASASVFVSMSDHEGFGVPLVEAMVTDVPVLAYKAGAVPYTLGGAGVQFAEKRLAEVAEMAHRLASDERLRLAVLFAIGLIVGIYVLARLGLDLGALRVESHEVVEGWAGRAIVDATLGLFTVALFRLAQMLGAIADGPLFGPRVTRSFRGFAFWLFLATLVEVVAGPDTRPEAVETMLIWWRSGIYHRPPEGIIMLGAPEVPAGFDITELPSQSARPSRARAPLPCDV